MDVEKTIEFILDQQAKAEIRWQKAEERMERMEKRQARFEAGLDGLRKLVVMGMKMLNKATEERRELQTSIGKLVVAQKQTDQKFERLIEQMSRRSPNGHR